jgi:hypothetical protein
VAGRENSGPDGEPLLDFLEPSFVVFHGHVDNANSTESPGNVIMLVPASDPEDREGLVVTRERSLIVPARNINDREAVQRIRNVGMSDGTRSPLDGQGFRGLGVSNIKVPDIMHHAGKQGWVGVWLHLINCFAGWYELWVSVSTLKLSN